jgi:hypothetical protein
MKHWLLILCVLLIADCKRKNYTADVDDCDTMGNYYEDGEHYINRDFISDEGALDYNKTFEKFKFENANCHPTKSFNSELYNNYKDDNKPTTTKPGNQNFKDNL